MTLYDVTGLNNAVSTTCVRREVRCMMEIDGGRVRSSHIAVCDIVQPLITTWRQLHTQFHWVMNPRRACTAELQQLGVACLVRFFHTVTNRPKRRQESLQTMELKRGGSCKSASSQSYRIHVEVTSTAVHNYAVPDQCTSVLWCFRCQIYHCVYYASLHSAHEYLNHWMLILRTWFSFA